MISTVTRHIIRLVLILVATAMALVLLFLIIVGIARYERDEGHCPDAPVGELEAKILNFAKEQGIHLNEVEFVGTPRYHADTLGWWGFDLKSREGNYVATIDCDRRVTGFGKIQKLPLEPTKPTQ
ncbi:hypothetical protein [Burkholderia ubonensis]|uniref:hypothetical protein n=1 Tax=Burkholderia ubonensis TaxID=101571 RepID=UPI002AB1B230|nr:hypothetical protein [Burkholderia ubonensis]